MKKLGQELYVKAQTKLNNLAKDEEGSTAVEFMGIAAVAVVVIVLLMNWFGKDDGGGGLVEGLLTEVINGVKGLFTFK